MLRLRKKFAPTTETESNETLREHREGWHKFEHYIIPIILVPIIALSVKHFTFQLFRVDGESMEQLLTQDDRLMVEKTGKTISSLMGKTYIPSRYDIVVFNLTPEVAEEASADQFVKRVIGLPGERVVIKDGAAIIYNPSYPDGLAVDKDLSVELGRAVKTEGQHDVKVPDGHVFLMGDNRAESFDSREMGPIDSRNIVGKMIVRFYPFDRIEIF